jgi:hypothetical protein
MRIMKRTHEAQQVSRDDLLGAVLRKRTALIERDTLLLAEQLDLEAAGVKPAQASAVPDARRMAQTLLNGFAAPELQPGGHSAEARLFSIIKDREATQIAIDLLVSRELQARAVAVAEVMQAGLGDWRAIVRRRALALLELRAANRAAARFREAVTALSGAPPGLVCDRMFGPLFGPPIVGDQSYEFLKIAVAEGIVSAKEVAADVE